MLLPARTQSGRHLFTCEAAARQCLHCGEGDSVRIRVVAAKRWYPVKRVSFNHSVAAPPISVSASANATDKARLRTGQINTSSPILTGPYFTIIAARRNGALSLEFAWMVLPRTVPLAGSSHSEP